MATLVPINFNIAHKRGNTSKNNSYVGADGTLSLDTEWGEIRYHNGSTPGGIISGIKRTYSRPNLLYNGGFENGLDGWTFTNGTWGVSYHNRFGTICTCTNIGSLTGALALESDFIECAGNTPYIVTGDSAFWGTGILYFDFIFYTSAKVVILDSPQVTVTGSHDFSDTGRYTHANLQVSPPNAGYMKARAVCEGLTPGATFLGWRQIKVEQGYLPVTPFSSEETIKRLYDKVKYIDSTAKLSTPSNYGWMSAPDKSKLDKLSFGADNKIPADQLSTVNFTGGFFYKGPWNPNTGSPAIPTAAMANRDWYYKVSVDGTSSVTGSNVSYAVGDWLISDGVKWNYLSGTNVANAQAAILNALATTSELIKVENVESNLKTYVDSLYTTMRGFPVYISSAQPTATGPYLWIQKLPNGNTTFWIEDGA